MPKFITFEFLLIYLIYLANFIPLSAMLSASNNVRNIK